MQILLTVSELSRQAEISWPTVRKYADLGLIDSMLLSSGKRVFPQHSVDQAIAVKAHNLKHMTGKHLSIILAQ